ncbi:hypothetical protein DYB35_010610 [Aphanomyces astaci]|uniref:Peptidase A2 domain-containing protein n=1 Tax=Aphanomyces astaci TaxID=112090 RepID=A0A418DCJ6_APHAT|nr:hypothetical protein DYB35_010610 [Aphanomyces astaci]
MTQCGRLHESVKVADVSVGLSALLEEPNFRPLTGSGWERKAVAQDVQHSLHRQWQRVYRYFHPSNQLLRKQLRIYRGKEVDGRLPSGAPSVGELHVDHEACKQHGVPSVDRGRSPLPKVLLDSGSDETLVSEGLLVALGRLGASLNVETKPRLMLKPYGETTKPLHVTRQVQFKTVTLETSIGPLVLRGLRRGSKKRRWRSTFSLDVPLWSDWGFKSTL